jgi:hypothetical protein
VKQFNHQDFFTLEQNARNHHDPVVHLPTFTAGTIRLLLQRLYEQHQTFPASISMGVSGPLDQLINDGYFGGAFVMSAEAQQFEYGQTKPPADPVESPADPTAKPEPPKPLLQCSRAMKGHCDHPDCGHHDPHESEGFECNASHCTRYGRTFKCRPVAKKTK